MHLALLVSLLSFAKQAWLVDFEGDSWCLTGFLTLIAMDDSLVKCGHSLVDFYIFSLALIKLKECRKGLTVALTGITRIIIHTKTES